MLRTMPALAFLFALLCCAAITAQADNPLLGTWNGTGTDKGEKLVFDKDTVTVGGKKIPYRLGGAGVLLLGAEDPDRVAWQVTGNQLTLTMDDEKHVYERQGAAATKGTEPVAQGDNPLARRPQSDPFARAFEGEGVRLELSGSSEKGYRGKMVFEGKSYPAEASATGTKLKGKFQVGQDGFDFTANLAGDQLTLESGGNTYQLKGAPLAAAAAGGNVKAPPELAGVFTGKTTRWDHPRGWLSFDMPERWTVYQQADTGMVLNPGLTATDTLDAIIGLMWGRLEPQDQNQPVAALIEKRVPEMKKLLAEQGLTVGEPEGPIATYKGKDVPGAVLTFKSQGPQGQKLLVWFGGIVKRDSWLAVSAVVLEGKEQNFMPQVKRIFTSLEPKPPERNPKLEAALVGRSFSSSQYGKITGSAHHASYTFHQGSTVARRLISNVPDRPGLPGSGADSERTGRYEVCGDVLFLYFESGQEVGQVMQQGGQVSGIRMGNAEYK